MGSFFTVIDDPRNQRVFLYRADTPAEQCIWLDADPTGGTEIPMPAVLSKVDMGSATNGAGFIMLYKAGVKLAFTTNLPTTKALTTGTPADVTVVVAGGNPSYTYAWTKNGTPLAITGATIHFDGVAGDAGSYVCTVTDALGLIIVSSTMVVTVT